MDEIKVLLIDDNDADAFLIKRLLKLNNPPFNIDWAISADDGVLFLDKRNFDIILLDLYLGDTQGIETVEKFQKYATLTPVIVLTGNDDEKLAIDALSKGMQDYLNKWDLNKNLLTKTILYARERHRLIKALEISEEKLISTNKTLANTIEELSSTHKKVIQQERLNALGHMASGITHDFNNTLTPILGFSEMLLKFPEKLEKKETALHYLKIINTAAKDAANIVNRLREFYRYKEHNEKFSALNVNQIIEQVIMLTKPKWKDQTQRKGFNIKINRNLNDLPVIFGDESGIREILTNLIFNAIDSIDQEGSVTISTYQEKGGAVIEVKDTGAGMTEDVKNRCLEPFFTTRESGTGLGLSMVFGIIKRHEGNIEIDSESGCGSTFKITLPVNSKQEIKNKEQNIKSKDLKHLNVLVIDDEEFICEMLYDYLTEEGHSAVTASTGHEALRKFNENTFDLVITDQSMPEMNGEQLASLIKGRSPDMPVILLTGFGDIVNPDSESVNSLLAKPVNLNQLKDTIIKLFNK